ncbi:ATP-dependent zinc protease [Pseudomonas synxantha]|uniref:ATP-dependent zinc protease n=1 Tax=Pseudomonas synxantha TaxID=47883 RepID=A0ABS0UI61_9PSED|nr:ATP-dependent zinc protease [Pseudomonas synxantha]MBI6564017.1 ATP-dependent zinc protease [Pseudomonas synxantha]MBI6580445.1 ATP-dependent zinc protease [Pseudomonas synxantha]MBI6642050.1 ATP-dependent zinc protease [Pseudomonas synxantha]
MHALSKLILGCTFALMLPQLAFAASPAQVFGWEEEAVLLPEQTSIKIELDTSAENSYLAATNIEPFDKGSEKWVRFSVEMPKGLTGASVGIPFERKIVRTKKGKGLIGGGGHRQVVKMTLCIGGQTYQEELTLKNRGKKDYTVVLGRNTLQHLGAVDVTRTNTIKPECNASAAKQTVE